MLGRRLLCILVLSILVPGLRAQAPTPQQVDAAFPQAAESQGASRRVMEALKGLAGQLDVISKELKVSKSEYTAAVSARDKKKRVNEGVLEEYRRGEFCSGCKKTRAEFAPGERFPHDYRKIVVPTQQEIAEKEEELHRSVVPLEDRVQKLAAQIARLEKRAPAMLEQLYMGKALWVTAINLVDAELIFKAQTAKVAEIDERAKVRVLIRKQEVAARSEEDPMKRALLEKDLKTLREAEKRHDVRLVAIERLKVRLLGSSGEVASREADEFNAHSSSLSAYLDAARSPGTLSVLNRFGVGGSYQTAGGYFLMGEIPERWSTKTVPFVKGIVDKYLQMPGYSGFYGEMVVPSPSGGGKSGASLGAEDPNEAIKRALREERNRQKADEEAAAKARKAK